MKSYFFVLTLVLIFSVQNAQATTVRLFSLYRTNYYPEKTMVYDLEYDAADCRITDRQPISVYFVSTNSGTRLDGFSAQNRDYFNAREMTSPTAQALNFTFKAVNELEANLGSDLKFSISLVKNKSSCAVQTNFLKAGKVAVQGLRKINVNFNLKNILGLGEQPSSINWLKLIGQSSKCLVGSCS